VSTTPEQLDQLEADRKALLPWLWAASVFVMLASLISGTGLMMALGTPIVLAVLFPLSTDVGLIAALRGSGRLARHGLQVSATSALRWTSFGFSFALNVTGELIRGAWLAALFHGFMPVLMIVLAIYEDRYNAAIAGEIARIRAVLAALPEPVAAELESAPEPVAVEQVGEPAPKRVPSGSPARKRVGKSEEVLKAEIRDLLDAEAKGGEKVTVRVVTAACNVSPNRAAPALKALREQDQAEQEAAYPTGQYL
jgi:hypothetical protein